MLPDRESWSVTYIAAVKAIDGNSTSSLSNLVLLHLQVGFVGQWRGEMGVWRGASRHYRPTVDAGIKDLAAR
jgi:hypothetical protein